MGKNTQFVIDYLRKKSINMQAYFSYIKREKIKTQNWKEN